MRSNASCFLRPRGASAGSNLTPSCCDVPPGAPVKAEGWASAQGKLSTYLVPQTGLDQQTPEVCEGDFVAFLPALLQLLPEFEELIWEQSGRLVLDYVPPRLEDGKLQVFGGPVRVTVQGSHGPGERQAWLRELSQPWSDGPWTLAGKEVGRSWETLTCQERSLEEMG